METMTLQQAVSELVNAYSALEEAKADFKTVSMATIDIYMETNKLDLSKTDIKNILKLAKARAAGKKKEMEIEVDSLKALADALA